MSDSSNKKKKASKKTSSSQSDKKSNLKIKPKDSTSGNKMRDETTAVILAAFGIFLILSVMTKATGGLGVMLSNLLKGLFGISAYILPFYILIYAALVLINRMSKINSRTVFFMILMFMDITMLNAVRFQEIKTSKLSFGYIKDMFLAGAELKSAGAVGMTIGNIIVKGFDVLGLCIIGAAVLTISIMFIADTPISVFFDKRREKKLQKSEREDIDIPEEKESKKSRKSKKMSKKETMEIPVITEMKGLKEEDVKEPEMQNEHTKSEPVKSGGDFAALKNRATSLFKRVYDATSDRYGQRDLSEPLTKNKLKILEYMDDESLFAGEDPFSDLLSESSGSGNNGNDTMSFAEKVLRDTDEFAILDELRSSNIENNRIADRDRPPVFDPELSSVSRRMPSSAAEPAAEGRGFDPELSPGRREMPARAVRERASGSFEPSPERYIIPENTSRRTDKKSVPAQETYSTDDISVQSDLEQNTSGYDLPDSYGQDQDIIDDNHYLRNSDEYDTQESYVHNIENQHNYNEDISDYNGFDDSDFSEDYYEYAPHAEDVRSSNGRNTQGRGHQQSSGGQIRQMTRSETQAAVTLGAAAVGAQVQKQAEVPKKQYKLPPVSLLQQVKKNVNQNERVELAIKAKKLEQVLHDFGVNASVIDVKKGPSVTRYEIQPATGVKVSKIVGLSDDIALNLEAKSLRIEAPIPGKAAVGIEVENESSNLVSLREMIESEEFRNSQSKISFVVGEDIAGNAIVADLKGMPHMLIAGSTGSGKSVCINSIIMSMLFKSTPDEVKLILIDPKVVELGNYNGIPHMLIPVVTDPSKAAAALAWAVQEMNDRYKKFADCSVRDLKAYNDKMKREDSEDKVLPQIVIIIDELADLMMAAAKQVEESICRLAQLARAAGMHLVVATQRPSVDVVTGLIKANVPSRIAFAVSSQVDSRTILDRAGAEKLVGKGDMLFYPLGKSQPERLQGPFVTDDEVNSVIDFWKAQADEDDSADKIMQEINTSVKTEFIDDDDDTDELFDDAVELIISAGHASASMLQRRFRIGYNRAGRLIDIMEARGIIGPSEGSKPRKVLTTKEEYYSGSDDIDPVYNDYQDSYENQDNDISQDIQPDTDRLY